MISFKRPLLPVTLPPRGPTWNIKTFFDDKGIFNLATFWYVKILPDQEV